MEHLHSLVLIALFITVRLCVCYRTVLKGQDYTTALVTVATWRITYRASSPPCTDRLVSESSYINIAHSRVPELESGENQRAVRMARVVDDMMIYRR
jgi:hypothetical protein